MNIDISKLDPVTFSILVLWLNGAFSTSEIAKAIDVTVPKVKAAVRAREHGGHMPVPRDQMSHGDRQHLLNMLKSERIDGGTLKYDWCFVASRMKPKAVPTPSKPLSDYIKKPAPEPRPEPPQSRKERQRRKQEERRAAEIERQKQAERERGWNASRGINASPLEWLYEARLLADPQDVARRSLDKTSSEMRRHESGSRFRRFLEDAQIGGFKEVSLEVSTGGMGIAIQERFVVAQSALRSIQTMIPERDYVQLVAVVFNDEFIWKDIPSKVAKDFIYEEIRRGLDTVALYLGMMPDNAFEARWGSAPTVRRGKNREEARETIREALNLIKEGIRQS